jgi:two-component system nitrate/nitrite response regulator NarL
MFTNREIEVLRLLAAGLPNKIIAYRLDLKEGTVKVHMRNLLKKLKVGSRTQAALFASRHFEFEEPAK